MIFSLNGQHRRRQRCCNILN